MSWASWANDPGEGAVVRVGVGVGTGCGALEVPWMTDAKTWSKLLVAMLDRGCWRCTR